MKNVSPTKAMGWMEPCTTCSTYICEIFWRARNQDFTRKQLLLSICAASFITDQGPPTAVAIGSIDVLSILLPDKMMQLLEYTTDFQPNDYKLRFVTQAAGVHSLCHLAQFFALWQGKDPITSVGYSAITTAVLGLLVCVIGPNLRKSDAPLAPISPLIGMYAFMSWKLL